MPFEANPTFEQELTHSVECRTAMHEAAEVVKTYALHFDETIKAPWMPRHEEPIIVVTTEAGTYVVNTDYAGVITEFGGKDSPPYAPLRRAARAAGLKLAEAPKGAPRLNL